VNYLSQVINGSLNLPAQGMGKSFTQGPVLVIHAVARGEGLGVFYPNLKPSVCWRFYFEDIWGINKTECLSNYLKTLKEGSRFGRGKRGQRFYFS